MTSRQKANEDWRQLGEGWVHAITAKNLEHLASFCQPDIYSRILLPSRFEELKTADALLAKFRQWFGDCQSIRIQEYRIERIGNRLSIYYLLEVDERGARLEVAQQIYGTLRDGLFDRFDLLCGGFHPVGRVMLAAKQSTSNSLPSASPDSLLPHANALLAMNEQAEWGGASCAILTPAIKAKMREMVSGQVLEVQVRDPTARGDIEAWCRLSGNELLTMVPQEQDGLSFFLRKK